jgi:DnaJ homolog subfamily C member 28
MSDQPEPPDRDAHPLRRVTGRSYESLIDQQIRQAEAEGQFRNLAGAGRPLDLDDDKDVPEELRVGFRMLKNAGYAPPWIELQKSIREDQAALEAWLARANQRWPRLGEADRAALRAEYEQKLRDLNTQIAGYNLSAPPVAGQLPLLQPWRELRKLGE